MIYRRKREYSKQIEPEAVNVVLRDPILERVLDHARHHRIGPIERIAGAGDVVREVVVRRDIPKYILVRRVVVNHVHDDADALPVEVVDHLFDFKNTVRVIGGSLGVVRSRHIVIERIVSPVETGILRGRTDAVVIVEKRHDLNMGHAHIDQMVDTGAGSASRSVHGGACVGHPLEVPAIC